MLGDSSIAQITNYVDQAIKRLKLAPVSLSPLGGVLGQLSQEYISYDSNESESSSGSSSLIDNMNHIRYRIKILEESPSAGSGVQSLALSDGIKRIGHIQLKEGSHIDISYDEGENAFYFTPYYESSDFDHNQLTNYDALEHINWTSAIENLLTSGSITGQNVITSGSFVFDDDNNPGFRLFNSKIQFSHDGITWENVGSGGIGEHDFIGAYHTGGTTVEEAIETLGLSDALTNTAHTAIGNNSPHHEPVTTSGSLLTLNGQEIGLENVLTPEEHTAIGDSSPHHKPVTVKSTSGSQLLTLNDQELGLQGVLTPELHMNIGNSNPHHPMGHSLLSELDHTDTYASAANGDMLVYTESINKWITIGPVENELTYIVFDGYSGRRTMGLYVPLIEISNTLVLNPRFTKIDFDLSSFDINSNYFVITSGSSTFNGKTRFVSTGSSIVPLSVVGSEDQAANLQEWKDSFDYTLASVGNDGTIMTPAIAGCSEIANNGSIKLYPGGAPGNEVVINELGGAYNFRVESDENTHIFFVDGENGRIGFGTSSPAVPVDIDLSLDITVLKAGRRHPVYIGNLSPFIGMNVYYGESSWRFGKGSSASYGALINLKTDTGNIGFHTSDYGNEYSPATLTEMFKIGPNGMVFNETGTSSGDVRMEGDTLSSLFFLDASEDLISISGSSIRVPHKSENVVNSTLCKRFNLSGRKENPSDNTFFDAISFTSPGGSAGSVYRGSVNGILTVTFHGRNTAGSLRLFVGRYWVYGYSFGAGAITLTLTTLNSATLNVGTPTVTVQAKAGASSTLAVIEMSGTYASFSNCNFSWNLDIISDSSYAENFISVANS